MAKYIKIQADSDGDSLALIDERSEITWLALNERVNQIIAAFKANGLVAGDTIGVFAGNCREYFEVMAAAQHSGVLFVPVNWHFTADELAYVLEDAGCKLLFVEEQFLKVVVDSAAENARYVHSIPRIGIRGSAPGFTDYESWFASESVSEPLEELMGGPMFYTSGTTGRPKGVRPTGRSKSTPIEVLEMTTNGMSGMLGIPRGGVTLLCGPVYHSAQWSFSFLPLMIGSTVVMRHKFNAAETLNLIDQYDVTNVHLVPTQFRRMVDLDSATRSAFKGSSLQCVWHGASPCSPQLKQQMIEWWGLTVGEYYGSTEGAIVTMVTAEEWLEKPGTVGKPAPTADIKIIDDNGKQLAQGQHGQIYVRNLMGADFEYHNEPEKTKAAHLEPGVYTFGDIGYFDEDGYLFLSDRKIDMIISGGVNIYPAEIEGVLASHPAVQDVAVFGIPNDEYGEEVKAAVCLAPDHLGSDDLRFDLMTHCRDLLAGYKCPKSIDFITEMPRHETGKLYKRILKDPYWEGSGRKI
ncbi:MAG: AMP-binding protein [Pseudomonadales bacterium]